MRNRVRGRIRGRSAHLVLLASASALLATGLATAGALSERSKSFAVPSGQTREGVASCKQGQAIAGGFVATRTEQQAAMLPIDSTREGRKGWRLRASNTEQDGAASVYVYCGKGTPRLTVESADVTLEDGEQGSAAAQCEPGEEAVAGGFDLPDTTTWLLGSKRTGEQTWELTVLNVADIGGASQTYTAFAYCDRSEPGLRARTKSITADQNERFGQSAVARCKRSEKLRSGGFETEYTVTTPPENGDYGLVHASRRLDERRWRATAHAPLGSPEVTAYAYCQS